MTTTSTFIFTFSLIRIRGISNIYFGLVLYYLFALKFHHYLYLYCSCALFINLCTMLLLLCHLLFYLLSTMHPMLLLLLSPFICHYHQLRCFCTFSTTLLIAAGAIVDGRSIDTTILMLFVVFLYFVKEPSSLYMLLLSTINLVVVVFVDRCIIIIRCIYQYYLQIREIIIDFHQSSLLSYSLSSDLLSILLFSVPSSLLLLSTKPLLPIIFSFLFLYASFSFSKHHLLL